MKEKIQEFELVKPALAFLEELGLQKIQGFLNCSKNKDESYTWFVRYKSKKVLTPQCKLV